MNEETTWEIRGDELHYGADAPLVRDPIRSLRVDLDGMRLRQSYSLHDGKVYPRTSLDGEGSLENATIGIAGEADSATSILSVALVRMSPEMMETDSEFQWRLSISFSPADWEIGSDDSWWAQAYLPTDVFDALLSSHRDGSAGKVWFHAHTDLWLGKAYVHAPPSARVKWYLDPGRRGLPGTARGSIEGFGWDQTPTISTVGGDPPQAGLANGADRTDAILQLTKVLKFGFAAVVVVLALLALR